MIIGPNRKKQVVISDQTGKNNLSSPSNHKKHGGHCLATTKSRTNHVLIMHVT